MNNFNPTVESLGPVSPSCRAVVRSSNKSKSVTIIGGSSEGVGGDIGDSNGNNGDRLIEITDDTAV